MNRVTMVVTVVSDFILLTLLMKFRNLAQLIAMQFLPHLQRPDQIQADK